MSKKEIIEKENDLRTSIASSTSASDLKAAKKAARKAKLAETEKKNSTKWQAFKYLCCTASAGIIQFVSFTIMTYAFKGLDWGRIKFITDMETTLFVATTVALALSVIWNFTLNRKFTFKSAKNVPVAMTLAFLFYVPFYPFQTWYVHAVSTAIAAGEIGKLIAEATVMLINGVLEFCWQKFVIYRKDANTANISKEDETVNESGENLELEHIKNSCNITADDIDVGEEDFITKD